LTVLAAGPAGFVVFCWTTMRASSVREPMLRLRKIWRSVWQSAACRISPRFVELARVDKCGGERQ